jgi:hypothetical protein
MRDRFSRQGLNAHHDAWTYCPDADSGEHESDDDTLWTSTYRLSPKGGAYT